MKRQQILGASIISSLTMLIAIFLLHLQAPLVFLVTTFENIGLLWVYHYALRHEKSLAYRISSISLIGLIFYLYEATSYAQEISIIEWVSLIGTSHLRISGYALATLLGLNYFLMRGFIIKEPKISRMDEWLPLIWTVIIAWLYLMIYRGELTNQSKLICSLACFICLIIVLLDKSDQDIVYIVEAKGYRSFFLIFSVCLITGMSLWPNEKSLPGRAWIQEKLAALNEVPSMEENVPYETSLTEGIAPSRDILFQVEAEEPLYLRQMAYSNYEEGTWHIPEDKGGFIPFKPTYLEAEYAQLDWFIENIKWAKEIAPEEEDFKLYDEVLDLEVEQTEEKSFYIPSNPKEAQNYFTVNGINKISSDYEKTIYYYHGLEYIYFQCSSPLSKISYHVDYYKRPLEVGKRNYELVQRLKAGDWQRVWKKIETLKENGANYDQLNPSPTLLESYTPLRQYEKIYEDFNKVPGALYLELYRLTSSVIDRKASDWQKAAAIEAYLKANFSYQFEAEVLDNGKDPIYNFLFETKEGICQDFATSMVLMCRSVGLPARYVTGYMVTEKNEKTGLYTIRKKDAHAFVEVYIAGYGWMQFDPTPAAVTNSPIVLEQVKHAMERVSGKLGLIVGILFVMLGGYLLASGYLIEQLWRYLVKRKPREEAIKSILKRSLKGLSTRGLGKEPEETLSQYGQRIKEQVDLCPLITIYEAYQYGHQVPTEEQIKEALQFYELILKLKQ